MKLKIILALALLLDVVLAGMVVHLRRKPEAQPLASPAAAVKSEAPPRARPAPARPLPLASPNRPAQGFDWRVIESEDYTQYIANLRGIGCPEETIRDIIIADVNKLYESRKQDSRKQAGPFKYWKAGQPILSGSDPDRMKQHQALDQEKRELLKALLGANAPEAPDPMAQAMSQLGEALEFLPPEKQAKAMGAMQELQAKIAQATGNRGGQPGTNDPARIKALIDEYNVSLSQWLTPAEKEQFDLTVSQTAQSMRNQLGTFNPTEQEFRDIYKIRKPFDDEFQFANRSSDPAVIDRREAAYFDTERQLRQLLGDARYAEYRTSRDYIPNTPLRQIAEAEGIPPERATQVLELRDLAREQALRVRLDGTLNDAQREVTLAAIQSQTRSAINGMLGEKAATAYFEKPVARRWFDGLMPGRLAEARTVPPPGP